MMYAERTISFTFWSSFSTNCMHFYLSVCSSYDCKCDFRSCGVLRKCSLSKTIEKYQNRAKDMGAKTAEIPMQVCSNLIISIRDVSISPIMCLGWCVHPNIFFGLDLPEIFLTRKKSLVIGILPHKLW